MEDIKKHAPLSVVRLIVEFLFLSIPPLHHTRAVTVPSYQVAHDLLHVISARCVERDLHTIAPGPLERTCWRQFTAQ